MTWLEPFQVRFSLQKEKFATGAFRDAYEANALSGIEDGKYIVKKFKEDQIGDMVALLGSIDGHTRKAVQ